MRQRAMIAMAISCEPALLLADEPTTALDVTTQARILDLLAELSLERNMAVLFVTHNLAVANDFCDRIDVMYSGRVVESGPAREVLAHPRHPYTQALRDSLCTLDTDPSKPLFSLGQGATFPTETADMLEAAR
jgi:ABC-type dipeptide/oligopeptide/nickel transport system ATPase component